MKLTKKQLQAAEDFHGALQGDRKAAERFVEGISTSDYPVQLNPALNKIALGNYAEQPKIWTGWATKINLPDFRQNQYWQFNGFGDTDIEPETAGYAHNDGSLPRVPEYDEYPVIRFSASEKGLTLVKSGVQIKISWEAIINDRDFDLLRRIPAEFGRRAAQKEDEEATLPLLSSTNFSVGNNNLYTNNPALTLESLEGAFQAISQQTYNGRRVIPAQRYALVVPPALEFTANKIKTVTEVTEVITSGSTETRQKSGNPVSGKFDVVVNPYINQLGTGSNLDTSWWLIPKPGSTPNPSVVNAFLTGRDKPQIFVQKTTTGDPVDGAFIDDSYSTKVRHVVTGGFIEPAGTLFSNGSGS